MATINYNIPTINGDSNIDIAGDVNSALNAIDRIFEDLIPVSSENIENGAITAPKLSESAKSSILQGFTVYHFDSTDNNADNTGMVTPSGATLAGYYIKEIGMVIISSVKVSGIEWGYDSSIIKLPTYVPSSSNIIQISECGILVWNASSNFVTWSGIRYKGRALSPNSGIKSSNSANSIGTLVFLVNNANVSSVSATFSNAEKHNEVL